MKKISANGKEYTLEYSFSAAEHKDTVQKMFYIVSGAYLTKKIGAVEKSVNKAEKLADAMFEGTSEMIADIPHIVKTAFYSGLLENHNVSENEAYEIMKAYMKENKISFRKLFDDIKECMEEDGFFDLSGLTEMIAEMGENVKTNLDKATKKPQDHKKKSTSIK